MCYAIGWEFDPVSFDPFPAAITGGDFGLFLFTSGSASITIGGVSHSMDGVFLQDSSDSPVLGLERFGTTGFTYDLAAGQTFEWSGAATFDLAAKGLTFGDLQPGSTGPISGLGNIMGELVVVPEPSASGVFFAFAAVAAILLRRR